MVVTKGPGARREDGFNLGIYRMQVTGRDTTLMRWLKHRGGAQHHQRWSAERAEPLPAAAVIGADPGTILAAVTPVPDTLSEYQFAGLLRGRKVELVDCKTVPLKVPAQAEIVLEGHVSLDEYGDEGPYGDHTGYYNSVERFPVFRLSAITMRASPIYLSTFTGRPPDEPSILGEALNEVFIPLLQQQFPEIVDFWLPPEGCSYRIAVVSIRKAYPGHAKRVMMGIWSFLRQFMYTKFVIVVDDDIDARNWKDVMWAVSTRMDPVRDVTLGRPYPDRLSRLRLARIGARRQDRPRCDRQDAARNAARVGPADPHDRSGGRRGNKQMGELRAARIGQADLEMNSFTTETQRTQSRLERIDWCVIRNRYLFYGQNLLLLRQDLIWPSSRRKSSKRRSRSSRRRANGLSTQYMEATRAFVVLVGDKKLGILDDICPDRVVQAVNI